LYFGCYVGVKQCWGFLDGGSALNLISPAFFYFLIYHKVPYQSKAVSQQLQVANSFVVQSEQIITLPVSFHADGLIPLKFLVFPGLPVPLLLGMKSIIHLDSVFTLNAKSQTWTVDSVDVPLLPGNHKQNVSFHQHQ